ncbi:MAG: hypothetical protein Sv326_0475 [Candidatus Fermentimicrarchaeum limneticum]|uniref:Uncharacterized protein n=1 Tax=Fermentimicrarchaeum limneticum TaxID=2795018 RepID=A0A7D5XJG7_FERL1|nr:MAG: hypothetical protein Sv326_0475 [Candidatus Fermentimicrarchaeum limneticum]
MPLSVLHSFIHQTEEKTTSLTISLGDDALFMTLSDKVNKNRVKLDLDEVAGLAEAIEKNRSWSAFHTFTNLQNVESKNRISYNDGFFSVEGEKKVAMKLGESERAAFKRVLEFAFNKMIERKLEQGRKFGK